jgi:hypothetical protein
VSSLAPGNKPAYVPIALTAPKRNAMLISYFFTRLEFSNKKIFNFFYKVGLALNFFYKVGLALNFFYKVGLALNFFYKVGLALNFFYKVGLLDPILS